ncbi:hypothetical protein RJ640_007012 [Escallonia rubra]|uniref:Disease resistance RPP13-like protein 1 n=1 Tax=Escallonia rubra TaxID=112253 RepID=A0AA88RLF8_9ASTE|nr:hypothetical protein RJ640_007012 [Escallonia rubra]
MVVTEIFISALVTVLFEKLASGELLNLARRQGIYSHIETWSLTLEKVEAVLGDAEEKQITDKPVNKWLEQLQDLAYDLDDILDELATEALSRKLMQESQISTSKLRRLVPACCTTSNFSPRVVKFDFKMKSKIDSITTRLQDLVKQKNELSLSVHVGGSSLKRTGHERLPTTSLVDESGVYGREEDKRAILDQMSLGAVQHSDRKVRVIAIVGMGGIGKTTLAQQVYNDEKVKSCFDLKAWVCISDVFDEFLITKIIFEALSAESRDFKDLNMAQVKLQEILSNKKFLLVFDDVWNENYGKWDLLSRPFHVGAPGSTIIATTRNVGVASIMRSVPDYHLERLEDEDICSIVAQLALGTHDFEAHPDFKQIGEAIVEKCKGLSLAAKTLGSLLRTKVSPNEWKDILNSKLWDLPKQSNDILPALRLSYHHLPSHLKCLFAYCSIFPKDYEFDKYELVLLWMAEGFLKQSENPKEMEDVGFCYFDELLGRSLFQCSSSRQSRFLMHDLVNDLAQHVAGRICFRLDNKTESNMRHSVFLQKARHSSFVRHEYEVFQRFEAFNRAPNLRTFLPLPVCQTSQGFYLTKQVSSDLLPQLLRLRVLSFSGYSICELPNSIGNLKHLRYLNLSDTRGKELPESVSELYNLQTFALRCCKQLAKLPKNTGNLINLRHLDIAGTSQLKEMPLGIGKLTSLQTLSKIVLDRSRGLRVNELRGLSNLRGALSIIGLHSVMKVQDAVEANLLRKQGLDELEMEWSTGFDGFRNKRTEKEVFDVLKPSTNLRALKVESYGGIEFPSWLGDPSFSSLACMTLRGCKECISLPSLGHLPSLKELRIKGMDGVKNVGAELCGIISPQVKAAFPALTILEFDNMVGLVEWSTNLSNDVENVRQVFPSLASLG